MLDPDHVSEGGGGSEDEGVEGAALNGVPEDGVRAFLRGEPLAKLRLLPLERVGGEVGEGQRRRVEVRDNPAQDAVFEFRRVYTVPSFPI